MHTAVGNGAGFNVKIAATNGAVGQVISSGLECVATMQVVASEKKFDLYFKSMYYHTTQVGPQPT